MELSNENIENIKKYSDLLEDMEYLADHEIIPENEFDEFKKGIKPLLRELIFGPEDTNEILILVYTQPWAKELEFLHTFIHALSGQGVGARFLACEGIKEAERIIDKWYDKRFGGVENEQ